MAGRSGPGGASTAGVGARRCYDMCRGAALVTGLASHRGRGAAMAGLPLVVVVLAAAIIDVVQHEESGPAGYLDGTTFSFAGNKGALGWLRGRRNAVLHHEQPTDGLMAEAEAAGWLVADAERAISTLLDYLTDLDISHSA